MAVSRGPARGAQAQRGLRCEQAPAGPHRVARGPEGERRSRERGAPRCVLGSPNQLLQDPRGGWLREAGSPQSKPAPLSHNRCKLKQKIYHAPNVPCSPSVRPVRGEPRGG